MSDLGNGPEVFDGEKQRVFDEQRQFLCNYNNVVGNEETLQNVTDEDLEEGPVEGHCHE